MSGKKTTAKKVSTKSAKPAAMKSAKAASKNGDEKPKKLSALDAAAKVLAESKEPLNTRQMIEAMAADGLRTSPGGATPHATLGSTILSEVATTGKNVRFKMLDSGQFALSTRNQEARP